MSDFNIGADEILHDANGFLLDAKKRSLIYDVIDIKLVLKETA